MFKHLIRLANLGQLIMLIALSGLIYTIYPLISIYFFPPPIKANIESTEYMITIPTIQAQAPIIENVDPWLKENYEIALQQGVAAAKDFSIPGQTGLSFLFAHSSLEPWQMTHTNTAFLKLDQLNIGDGIIIDRYGQRTIYKVFEKKEISPYQVDILQQYLNSDQKILVLQTCTPIGTDWRRLLIFAKAN